MGYLFLVFVIYLLYRFITEFVLPISRSTKMMRQKVQEMNGQRENTTHTNSNGYATHTEKETPQKKEREGEYIDFEEVK